MYLLEFYTMSYLTLLVKLFTVFYSSKSSLSPSHSESPTVKSTSSPRLSRRHHSLNLDSPRSSPRYQRRDYDSPPSLSAPSTPVTVSGPSTFSSYSRYTRPTTTRGSTASTTNYPSSWRSRSSYSYWKWNSWLIFYSLCYDFVWKLIIKRYMDPRYVHQPDIFNESQTCWLTLGYFHIMFWPMKHSEWRTNLNWDFAGMIEEAAASRSNCNTCFSMDPHTSPLNTVFLSKHGLTQINPLLQFSYLRFCWQHLECYGSSRFYPSYSFILFKAWTSILTSLSFFFNYCNI